MKNKKVMLRGKMYFYQKEELIPQDKIVKIDKDVGKPKDISVKDVDTSLKIQTANPVKRKKYKISNPGKIKNNKKIYKSMNINKDIEDEASKYSGAEADKDIMPKNDEQVRDIINEHPEYNEKLNDPISQRIIGKPINRINRTAVNVNKNQVILKNKSNNISSHNKISQIKRTYKPDSYINQSDTKENENDIENQVENKSIVYINKKCINTRKKFSRRNIKEANMGLGRKVIDKTNDIVDEQSQNDSGAATISSGFKVVRGLKLSAEVFGTSQTISKGIVKGVKISFKGLKLTASIPTKIKNGELKKVVHNKISDIKLVSRRFVSANMNIRDYEVKKITVAAINYAKRDSVLAGKIIHKGSVKIADTLSNTDDMGLNSVAVGIKTVNLTGSVAGKSIDEVKHIKYIPGQINGVQTQVKHKINTAVNTAIQTGKVAEYTYQAVKTEVKKIKNDGIKASLKRYGQKWKKSVRYKAKTAVIKAGESVVTATFMGIKSVAIKVALPIIVASMFIIFFINMISGVGVATASIFSPFISNKSGKEINETEWLKDKIDSKRIELIENIQSIYDENLKKNNGKYDYVQIYSTNSAVLTAVKREDIAGGLYTTKKYIQLIQPIFHVMMLTKYELNADENEMTEVFNDIWDNINNVTIEKLEDQYCEEGIRDHDGLIHADLDTCPNHSEIKYHDSNAINAVMSTCDVPTYICKGHKDNLLICGKAEGLTETRTLTCKKIEHKHTQACYVTKGVFLIKTCPYEEHQHSEENGCYSVVIENHKHVEWKSETEPGCYATKYCTPDKKMTQACTNCEYTITCKGYAECLGHSILNIKIVQNSFDDLLYRYYGREIEELESRNDLSPEEKTYLNNLKDNYDICSEYIKVISEEMGVDINGIISYDDATLEEITSLACSYIGNPYVYGGTDIQNGIDCSAFVQYIYKQFGKELPRTSREQVKCGQVVGSIAEAKQGDLIFYADDSNHDGAITDDEVYHVALYIGDNKIVHASNEAPYPQGGIKISYVGTPYKIIRL